MSPSDSCRRLALYQPMYSTTASGRADRPLATRGQNAANPHPSADRLEPVIRAAFFDLDRTFIRRSSALALAGAFRERGIISRRQLAKAGLWQLLFAARGADPQTVTNGIADGIALLRGVPAADVEQMATDAVDPVLRPLVYPDALALAAEHRRRGEPVYLVTASLQEIVAPFAAALGLDGAIGSIGEIDAEGRYTGAVVRACHGAGKAAAVRELEGVDLGGVDRVQRRGRRPAAARGRRASRRRQRRPRPAPHRRGARLAHARLPAPPVPGRRPRRWLTSSPRGSRRSASPAADARTLAEHFADCERRGKLGHGRTRVDWLETLPDLHPEARPRAPGRRAGLRALGRRGGARLPHARRDLRRAARRAAGARAGGRRRADVPDRCARLLGAPACRGRPRRRADRDLAAAAPAPRGRPAADGHEPARDRRSELGRARARQRHRRWVA